MEQRIAALPPRVDEVSPGRLMATLRMLQPLCDDRSVVVEIGSDRASFADLLPHQSWTTVDKYGDPDHVADLDGLVTPLPFADGSVDVLICTEVLEHLRSGSALVAEISRVLASTGTAVISVPNIASLKSRVRVLAGGIPNLAASGDCGHPLGGTGSLIDGQWVGGHVVDFNIDRLRAYLSRGGLMVTHHASVPVGLGRLGIGPLAGRTVPLPPRLSDYLLVSARPVRRPH